MTVRNDRIMAIYPYVPGTIASDKGRIIIFMGYWRRNC